MSKAILVIDMPNKCGNCPLLQQWYDDEYEKWSEMCFYRYCEIEDTESKLNICPLKPLPKSINEEKAFDITKVNDHTYLNGVVDGFSICLDEMLNGEENE